MSIKSDKTGLECPMCHKRHTKVIGGYTFLNKYVRQRRCTDCGKGFKTVESYEVEAERRADGA